MKFAVWQCEYCKAEAKSQPPDYNFPVDWLWVTAKHDIRRKKPSGQIDVLQQLDTDLTWCSPNCYVMWLAEKLQVPISALKPVLETPASRVKGLVQGAE